MTENTYEIVYSNETPDGVYAAINGNVVGHGAGIADELNRLLSENQKLQGRVESLDAVVLEEIENRDAWEERATNLANHVGEYFSTDVGEHSSANCPINNAHDLLNQI